jgi:hypothetical protein
MFTWMMPALAVANWATVHSQRLVAQTPTRSPGSNPSSSRARAMASTRAPSSDQVKRMPWAGAIKASRSGHLATAASKARPIVPSSSGESVGPFT